MYHIKTIALSRLVTLFISSLCNVGDKPIKIITTCWLNLKVLLDIKNTKPYTHPASTGYSPGTQPKTKSSLLNFDIIIETNKVYDRSR